MSQILERLEEKFECLKGPITYLRLLRVCCNFLDPAARATAVLALLLAYTSRIAAGALDCGTTLGIFLLTLTIERARLDRTSRLVTSKALARAHVIL